MKDFISVLKDWGLPFFTLLGFMSTCLFALTLIPKWAWIPKMVAFWLLVN